MQLVRDQQTRYDGIAAAPLEQRIRLFFSEALAEFVDDALQAVAVEPRHDANEFFRVGARSGIGRKRVETLEQRLNAF
jgi:hypothetical protein